MLLYIVHIRTGVLTVYHDISNDMLGIYLTVCKYKLYRWNQNLFLCYENCPYNNVIILCTQKKMDLVH